MTVTNPRRSVTHNGNGVTTVFPVANDGPIYFLNATELVVTLIDADGTETRLMLGAGYSVSGAGNPSGGSVTTVAPPAAGQKLRIERLVPLVQPTQYPENTKFPAASHERALDRLTMVDQQQQEDLSRAPKFPKGHGLDDVSLPVPEDGKAFYYDAETGRYINGKYDFDSLYDISVENREATEQAKDRAVLAETRANTARDRSETARDLAEGFRDDAADSASASLTYKTQAELAALAAGAPLFTDEPPLASAPSPYLLQVDAGTQVWTHDGTTRTMVGWLGKVSFNAVDLLLSFTGTLGVVGETVHAEGLIYKIADSNATDHHLTTAGGVKLYFVSGGGRVSDRAELKSVPTYVGTAFLQESDRQGSYIWNASVPVDRHRADSTELTYVAPNAAAPGAWVRSQLSALEKTTINRALNERPYEAPPEVIDHFNALIPSAPAFGRQINVNSTSENLADAHYAYDALLTRVSGDTINWHGIELQRITGASSFASALRDVRVADYPLVPGTRYIASAIVCAPFIEADVNGLKGPWNRFSWMWGPANATSFGHGAKLIGPVPRRVWQIVEADTETTVKVVRDPAVALSSQTASALIWWRHSFGLGGTLAGKDIYIGGLQLEVAPDQTEKTGIALIGTSIEGSGTLDHRTQERLWPRFLEGLLSVPIFNGAVGGQTSTQLEARFDTDVAPWGVNAKYCILAANVNDFAAGFNSATYRANWLSMYNKAIAAGMIPIFMTPPRRSLYNYANGPADMEAEIAYIKETYPFVIDRDYVWQDPFNPGLLNEEYEDDGIHPYFGMRQLAFMIYAKYRHFFSFNNVPGPYQKTEFDNSKIQSFGGPIWAGRYWASRVTTTGAPSIRDTEAGTAPILIFEATLTGDVTYQLPCANYYRDAERVNTDVQVQQIRNVTAGGFSIRVQYYKRDGAGALSAVGPVLGPIPTGETWTVATDGVTAWRVL